MSVSVSTKHVNAETEGSGRLQGCGVTRTAIGPDGAARVLEHALVDPRLGRVGEGGVPREGRGAVLRAEAVVRVEVRGDVWLRRRVDPTQASEEARGEQEREGEQGGCEAGHCREAVSRGSAMWKEGMRYRKDGREGGPFVGLGMAMERTDSRGEILNYDRRVGNEPVSFNS